MTAVTITHAPHPTVQVQRHGFDLDSIYVDRCWTPVLGCTAVTLLRRLPAMWAENPFGWTVDVDELGASLGVGRGVGKNAPVRRTLDRLVRFRLAEWARPDELAVFVSVPPLSTAQLDRVPRSVHIDHARLLDEHTSLIGVS